MSSTVPCRFRIFWASARMACSIDSPSCRFGLASARPIAFSRLLAAALRYVDFRASRGVLMARQKNSGLRDVVACKELLAHDASFGR